MGIGGACGACHAWVAVEREPRDDGVRRVGTKMRLQARFVPGIQQVGGDSRQAVSRRDTGCSPGEPVREVDGVGPRFGEQSGNEGANFAGTQDQYPLHGSFLIPLRNAKCAASGYSKASRSSRNRRMVGDRRACRDRSAGRQLAVFTSELLHWTGVWSPDHTARTPPLCLCPFASGIFPC